MPQAEGYTNAGTPPTCIHSQLFRTSTPGAREAILVLSSPTVEAAEWHLERAARQAAINDPNLAMQGVLDLNAVIAKSYASNPNALEDATKRQIQEYDQMKAIEEENRMRARAQNTPY